MELARYLGANLMTKYTAFLNAYGAEESPDFKYEESFDGTLCECLKALARFQQTIDSNHIDCYLSLEAWNGDFNAFGDFRHILEELADRGYITGDTLEAYY